MVLEPEGDDEAVVLVGLSFFSLESTSVVVLFSNLLVLRVSKELFDDFTDLFVTLNLLVVVDLDVDESWILFFVSAPVILLRTWCCLSGVHVGNLNFNKLV